MKRLFYIVMLCVVAQTLTFTYVKGANVIEAETESMELEDCSTETDNSEETEEEVKGHCHFWEPFTSCDLFFGFHANTSVTPDEFILSHILPVECPPPRV